jgi:hypothetical protein
MRRRTCAPIPALPSAVPVDDLHERERVAQRSDPTLEESVLVECFAVVGVVVRSPAAVAGVAQPARDLWPAHGDELGELCSQTFVAFAQPIGGS